MCLESNGKYIKVKSRRESEQKKINNPSEICENIQTKFSPTERYQISAFGTSNVLFFATSVIVVVRSYFSYVLRQWCDGCRRGKSIVFSFFGQPIHKQRFSFFIYYEFSKRILSKLFASSHHLGESTDYFTFSPSFHCPLLKNAQES